MADYRDPEACLNNECEDEECEHCGGHGLDRGLSREQLAELDRKDDELNDELDKAEGHEDLEHQDVHERIGMVYEPKEPAILLVSKEARAQCLPIYYAKNPFSWRFLWLNYPRSLDRFNKWVNQIRHEDARHITKLTFEGRHTVEEGVEFEVDIDILEDDPFFEVKAASSNGQDSAITTLKPALEQHISHLLEKWLIRNPAGRTLCQSRLDDLAEVFVKSMHHDPAAGASDEPQAFEP
ncbi:hypothetical protein LTR37_001937 [Vermiconidia calcicola]|uniref:Uncharacterized protein n=1 Tax=Vermiconidia calcicola TaxID=1690605 RepID=A0ACC3NUK4_9PEZI|nr:hypothetical protein LTR37_001937 [Vermiconidia calcicola]